MWSNLKYQMRVSIMTVKIISKHLILQRLEKRDKYDKRKYKRSDKRK